MRTKIQLPGFLAAGLFFLSSLAAAPAFAQGWSSDPFDQKVFVENKGQFAEHVRFGAARQGVQLFFSAKGVTFTHEKFVPMKKREIEAIERAHPQYLEEEEEEERENWKKAVPQSLSVEWLGANPQAELIAQEPVSFYYTYGGEKNIKANAFKKIIYKNLYPHVDAEYVFPSDSSGVKYSLILHPGADPSLIRMKYKGAQHISIDAKGNLRIKSQFGTFVDHAPFSFYSETKTPINSSFTLKENIISFQLDHYDRAQKLTIDPWTTIPTFTGYNAAYDVNYDLNGNVYAYGSFSPFQLIKISSAGAVQWIFNATGMNGTIYGDFALDEMSGTSYLVEGWSFGGAKVYKVNTSGVSAGTLPANVNLNEMWRAEYNSCIGQIVIGAGGTGANSQAFMLDTNLTALTPINVLSAGNAFHDMVLLAIDPSSASCYMASATSTFAPNNFDNVLVKCPIPGLAPPAFMVPDGHKFMEQGSTAYINGGGFGNANGVNGMTASPAWLYTYDGDSLKRWDKNSGAYVMGIDVSPSPPVYSGTAIRVFWGGLSHDECDHVFAGMATSIIEYDTALAIVNTYNLPDTVHDVKMGLNGKLYACGQNFVAQIDLPASSANVSVTELSPACNLCDGVAAVSAVQLSCAANPANFTYAWSTTPVQTSDTATGLCPGNYTVTLTTGCHTTYTGTVQITSAAGPSVNLGNDTTVCSSPAILLDAGTASSYLWSTGDTTQTITAASAGTYWVTVTNNGCSATDTITIFSVTAPALGNDTSLCAGQPLQLSASAGSSYLWSTGATTQTISVIAGGQYWVNVSAGNCVLSDTINVVFVPYPSPALPDTTLCPGDSLVLDAGTGTAYQWSTGAGDQTIQVSTAGTYSVLVSNGPCQTMDSALVSLLPPVALQQNISLCEAESFTLDAGSANATYAWSTGATTSSIMITESGTYWVTVTSNGCTLSDTTHITGELGSGLLFVPNTFTPNKNGLNERFMACGADITQFHLMIFNRWGELLFETSDMTQGWDGTYMNELVQVDTYVWKIEYKTGCTKDELIERVGHVNVIR